MPPPKDPQEARATSECEIPAPSPCSESKVLHVTIDPRYLLADFHSELGRIVAGMESSLQAIANGSYLHLAREQRSVVQVGIQRPTRLDVDAESQRILRDSLLAVLRAFGELVDRLIALRDLLRAEIPRDPMIANQESLDRWIRDRIDLAAVEIGANGKLKAPAKIRMIGEHPAWLLTLTEGYLALRRTLEHHHAVSQNEFMVQTYRMRITTGDGTRDVRINDKFLKGEHIEIFWEKRGSTVPAARQLTIDPEGVEHIAVSLALVIAPAMLTSLIDPIGGPVQQELPMIEASLILEEGEQVRQPDFP